MLRESDCRIMDTFELIDRINCADSWNDEDVDVVLRELWERYGLYKTDYDEIEDCDSVWNIVTRNIDENIETHFHCTINEDGYSIISINGDENSDYAVVDDWDQNLEIASIYLIGTMRECKNYIKELIDNA